MKFLPLLLLAFVLTSCFDLREEVRIEADGSGHLTFDYHLPSQAMLLAGGEAGIREQVGELLKDSHEVRLETLTVTQADGESHLHLEIATDSMLSLMDLKETEAFEALPASSRKLAGTFEVRIDGLKVDVDRRLDFADALGLASLGIGREDREKRRIEYIIHLPKAAVANNADRVEQDGRTLIWERSLGQALEEPFSTRYTAPIPLPAWLIPAVVVVAMLAVLGVISLVRKLRARLRGR